MGVLIKNKVNYSGGKLLMSPECYSAEEKEIGVWVDGKPLYQTTIHTGALTKDENWHSIAHNIPNIDKIILCTGTVYDIDNTAYPMPNYRPTYSLGICLDANTTNIEYIQNWLDTSPDSYVTLQYTKTTDQPGSGTWTPQSVPAQHYSNNEHIIGTWIDGSPLYEKSYHIASLSSTYITIDSTITPSNIKIRSSEIGSFSVGGAYFGAQYVLGHMSSSSFPRIILGSNGLNVGMENPPVDPITNFDFTIRYTKTTS